jgi:hypothetical protein
VIKAVLSAKTYMEGSSQMEKLDSLVRNALKQTAPTVIAKLIHVPHVPVDSIDLQLKAKQMNTSARLWLSPTAPVEIRTNALNASQVMFWPTSRTISNSASKLQLVRNSMKTEIVKYVLVDTSSKMPKVWKTQCCDKESQLASSAKSRTAWIAQRALISVKPVP